MGRIRTQENIAVGTLLIGIAKATGGYMVAFESSLNPFGTVLWSYSNQKPLSFWSSDLQQVLLVTSTVCKGGFYFADLILIHNVDNT